MPGSEPEGRTTARLRRRELRFRTETPFPLHKTKGWLHAATNDTTKKNSEVHISNVRHGTLLSQTTQFLPLRDLGGRRSSMKPVIRLILAVILLAASCSTPLMADGSNPPPKCTPKTCVPGR
jgi:hypothetical protein